MLEGLLVSAGIFIILGVLSTLGAWYTAKSNSPHALIGIFILFLTLAQFFAAKIAIFDLGFIVLVAPVGVIVFPFTLQVTDMVNEKFGRKAVYEMIWIALASQIIMVAFLILSGILPSIGDDLDPLASFSIVPAITFASWISFLISERFDAWIYDRIRSWIRFKSKTESDWWKYLWIRNIFSDIISLGLDSFLFIPLAFLILPSIQGLFDPTALDLVLPIEVIVNLIIGQLGVKWFLGVIDTPFMYLTRWIYDIQSKEIQ
ncbi:MAG: queuosine precursor transporter [Candidatus Hodarchaeales archaeon]|jgi:uncharacterized integral membrane protein (TIGR00697 family)